MEAQMGRHVIIGAGTIGSALAVKLADEGREVAVVSRRGAAPRHDGVSGVALDATNAEALGNLAVGADVLCNCANPRYDRWERDWPPIATSILAAASSSGAVLVTLSNLYGYGPVDHAMAESDPLAATSRKGRVRAEMWASALHAHDAGAVRATEVRASDFFGPTVRSTGMLGERVVPRILDHATISLLGDLDAPHSWTYVDDVARALQVVGHDPRAWGRAWHAPTAPPLSSREAVEGLAAAAGLDAPRVRRLPWSLVRVAGLASAEVRELAEIAYQFDRPFVVDSTAFTDIFQVCPTPLSESFAQTVAWWRQVRGFPLPSLVAAH
jgi:nucleoside-diphosphate-sugar epimerase